MVRLTAVLLLLTAAPLSRQPDAQVADGVRVAVRLRQFISSETSHPGEPVDLSVAADVRADGRIVIARNTPVAGHVVEAVPARFRRWIWRPRLQAGRLLLAIDETAAADGQRIMLRASPAPPNPPVSGAAVLTPNARSILRWAHEGASFDALVDGNYVAH